MAENSRKYSRVNTYMPFDVRVVSPGERDVKSRISIDGIVLDALQPPEITDDRLYQWLSTINAKLDMLLESTLMNSRRCPSSPLI